MEAELNLTLAQNLDAFTVSLLRPSRSFNLQISEMKSEIEINPHFLQNSMEIHGQCL